MKKAFTMIELIFVIVIIGILAAIAIPKLSATRTDAKIATIVQEVQNAITEIQDYVTAHGREANSTSLDYMSQTIKQLNHSYKGNYADNKNPHKFYIYGDEKVACVTLRTDDKNLYVEKNSSANGPICKGVKKVLGNNTEIYKLSSSIVNF